MFCCFFKQKTAYEMRISDWSSDVCSSDLVERGEVDQRLEHQRVEAVRVAGDGVARAGVGQQQLLQRRALDRRLAFGGDQRCALDRVVGEVGVERRVVLQVQLGLALLDLVQRRQADVKVAPLDPPPHLPVAERQKQGADGCAVHAGVGKDMKEDGRGGREGAIQYGL